MADLSKIKLPNDETYDLKDAVARAALEEKVNKDENTDIGTPDVDLIMQYSSSIQQGQSRMQSMCYAGNGIYVGYCPTSEPSGHLISIDSSTKQVLYKSAIFNGYHGNGISYYDGKIFVPTNHEDNHCHIVQITTTGNNKGKFSGDSTTINNTETSFDGSNVCYDRITGFFYGTDQENPGQSGAIRVRKYTYSNGTFTQIGSLTTLIPEDSEMLSNSWTQGAFVENNILYQIYWKTRNMIVAYDLNTGKILNLWNLPKYSNYCKVMDEFQALTYNWDKEQFVLQSNTNGERAGSRPSNNFSYIGLYENIKVHLPYILCGQGMTNADRILSDAYRAYMEVGDVADCRPCWDFSPYDIAQASILQKNKKAQIFRTLSDISYAANCWRANCKKQIVVMDNGIVPGSNPIQYHHRPQLSSPVFTGDTKIMSRSVDALQITNPVFDCGSKTYFLGTDTHKIELNGGGGVGYPVYNKVNGLSTDNYATSMFRVRDNSQVYLQHVTFTPIKHAGNNQGASLQYGIRAYQGGKVYINGDVEVASVSGVSISIANVPSYDKVDKFYTGICNTAASTATKVVVLDSFDDNITFSYSAGARIAVTFTNGNSATTPVLKIQDRANLSKTIAYPNGTNAVTTGHGTEWNRWGPYQTIIFTYNGTYWITGPSKLAQFAAYSHADSAQTTANNATAAAATAQTTANNALTAATSATDKLSSLLKLNTYTYTYTTSNLGANGSYLVQANSLKDSNSQTMTQWLSDNSSYTPIAAQQVSSGNGNAIARTWNVAATGTQAAVALRNATTTAQSGTVTLTILYAKSSVIG